MRLNMTAVANDDADRFLRSPRMQNGVIMARASGAEILAEEFFAVLDEKKEKYLNWISDFSSRIDKSGEKTQQQIITLVNKLKVIVSQIEKIDRKSFKAALYSTANTLISKNPEGDKLADFKDVQQFRQIIGINSDHEFQLLPPEMQSMITDFQMYTQVYLLDFVPGKKKSAAKPQLTVVNAVK